MEATQCDNCNEHLLVQDSLSRMDRRYEVLEDNQRKISEAIVKLSENMAFLTRMEDRVVLLEKKTNQMIGGIILSSVLAPAFFSLLLFLLFKIKLIF